MLILTSCVYFIIFIIIQIILLSFLGLFTGGVNPGIVWATYKEYIDILALSSKLAMIAIRGYGGYTDNGPA